MTQVMPMNTNSLDLDNLKPDLNGDGVVEDWEQIVYDKLIAADLNKDGFLERDELYSVIKSMGQEFTSVAKSGGIPISSLNPDSDGDGQVEPWEVEVFERIKAADADASGIISTKELFGTIRKMGQEVKEAKTGGIPIASLNPDSDGDGKVEPWEVDVFERIKAADADASGIISTKELFGVIKGAAESDKQKKLYRKLAMVLLGVVVVLIGLLVAVSIVGAVVGGNAIKEARVPDCSTGNDPLCSTGVVGTATIESFSPSVFGLAAAPINQMAYIKDVAMYVDMSSGPVGRTVEATFKVAGAYKYTDTQAFLMTTNGYTIALDATNKQGYITMGDTTYPITDTPPTTGRRLETTGKSMVQTMTARQMVQHHRERRRLQGDDEVAPMMSMGCFDSHPTWAPDMEAAAHASVGPMPSPGFDILEPSPSAAYGGAHDAHGAHGAHARQLTDELTASPMPSPAAAVVADTSWEDYMAEKKDYSMRATVDS